MTRAAGLASKHARRSAHEDALAPEINRGTKEVFVLSFKEPRRARRIRLTLNIAGRRWDDHLGMVHSGVDEVRCWCKLAGAHLYSKRRPRGCPCRKRQHGRPRADVGMCARGDRDRIYRWRQEVRRLQDAVRSGAELDLREERSWPAPREGSARPYVIEARRLGDESGAWHVVRAYRTKAGRDAALRNLIHKEQSRSLKSQREFRIGLK